jgi:GNAT superfamily N-acetyltransferase
MIHGKWFAPGTDLSPVLPVREAVFGRGGDELDAESWNVLVFQDDQPVGTGRIWWSDGAFRLGDLGVLEEYRRRKLGDLLLRLLLYKAQSHAAREVRLSCPRDLTGFFARLGLREESSGQDPVEMMIPGDRIDLDSCKNCPKADCVNRK